MYEADEQDEIIGDAMAVGRPAFVEELHWAAIDAAEATCPWDGNGTERVEYRRAWIAVARRLVAQRRAQLGDIVESSDETATPHSSVDGVTESQPRSRPDR